eukprot:m.53873 g.53873  ORF g.53873 m.53873 type:complete len:302 (-) comp13204_c1_seq2:310-1215(-)
MRSFGGKRQAHTYTHTYTIQHKPRNTNKHTHTHHQYLHTLSDFAEDQAEVGAGCDDKQRQGGVPGDGRGVAVETAAGHDVGVAGDAEELHAVGVACHKDAFFSARPPELAAALLGERLGAERDGRGGEAPPHPVAEGSSAQRVGLHHAPVGVSEGGFRRAQTGQRRLLSHVEDADDAVALSHHEGEQLVGPEVLVVAVGRVPHGCDAGRLQGNRGVQRARRYIPDTRCAVVADAGEPLAGGIESACIDKAGVALERNDAVRLQVGGDAAQDAVGACRAEHNLWLDALLVDGERRPGDGGDM